MKKSQSGQETTRERWLRLLHFTDQATGAVVDPFPRGCWVAEQDGRLGEYLIIPPGLGDHHLKVLEGDASCVVFWPLGSGKTAALLHLKRVYQSRKTLTIEYWKREDLLPLLRNLDNISLEDHIGAILSAAARALLDHLAQAGVLPQVLEAAQVPERPLGFRPTEEVKGPVWPEGPLAQMVMAVLSAVPVEGQAGLSQLGAFVSLICRLEDFDAVHILVDRVDGYPETADAARASQLMTPLFNSDELYAISGLCFKFFLSDTLREHLIGSRAVQRQRLEVLPTVNWTEERLEELVQERLKAESEYPSLSMLTEMEASNWVAELLREAEGSPRDLLHLCYLLFETHAQHIDQGLTTLEERWLIDEDYRVTIDRFKADRQRRELPKRRSTLSKIPLSDMPSLLVLVLAVVVLLFAGTGALVWIGTALQSTPVLVIILPIYLVLLLALFLPWIALQNRRLSQTKFVQLYLEWLKKIPAMGPLLERLFDRWMGSRPDHSPS